MTGNPRARNLEPAPSRLSSVSGARPVPTEPQPQDTWLDVDDVVELESRPAPAVNPAPSAAHAGALELEQRMREQQLELEQLRRESARRIQVAERERDAALAAVEELRASLRPESGGAFAASSLAPPLQVQPPLTATAPLPLAHSAPPVSPSRVPARVPADAPTLAPRADTPPQSRLREPGSVPTLSEVLVATDLLGHEPGAPDTDERRSEPRFSRQFEIEFNYETHFFAGLTLDISSGGLFIATYHLFPVGTALCLSFQLPDGRSLSVRGEVRWVRCASEGHERPGMGVAFKELAADALAAIAEFCEERPPLYVEL